MIQILIVEDDSALAAGLGKALGGDDRKTVICASLKAAREQLAVCKPALVLLDENLPDGNGLTLLQEIKAEGTTPVIILTANDTDADIVTGLEHGADDYITKPFSVSVLRARVNTQLKRLADDKASGIFTDGQYSFDFEKMIFTVGADRIELSKTEQRLLRLLVENAGNTVPRGTLIDRVWSDGAEFVDENALSVSVKRLRDKLSAADKIRTIYGIGYSWVK